MHICGCCILHYHNHIKKRNWCLELERALLQHSCSTPLLPGDSSVTVDTQWLQVAVSAKFHVVGGDKGEW